MTDFGNGTYSGNFTLEQSGVASLSVFLLNPNGVHADFYDNNLWQDPIAYHEITPNINYDWGTGNIFSTSRDYVSAHFYTFIKAPTTETYIFDILSDDGSDFYFDTQLVVNKLGTYGGNINGQFTRDLVEGEFYDF